MSYRHALADDEKRELLRIARATLREHAFSGRIPPGKPHRESLLAPAAVFVSLHHEDELRGCIGTFRPESSLAATVARMAVAAASEDPRFRSLGPDDLAGLDIAVSALGPPHPLADPRAVAIGREGLIVSRGFHRGTLLPKVAVEQGWGAEEFLKHTCLKAGLPPRAWEDPGVEVEVFEAEEFGEGGER